MRFDIVSDKPWLIAHGNRESSLNKQLREVAKIDGDDRFITQKELRTRSAKKILAHETRLLIKSFFAERIVRDVVTLKDDRGETLEKLTIFDNGDGRYTNGGTGSLFKPPAHPLSDVFFLTTPDGREMPFNGMVLRYAEYVLYRYFYTYDVADDAFSPRRTPVDMQGVLRDLAGMDLERELANFPPPDERTAWDKVNPSTNLGIAALVTFYRLCRTALHVRAGKLALPPLSAVVKFGEIRAVTDSLSAVSPLSAAPIKDFPTEPVITDLEHGLTANLLSSLLAELKIRPPGDKAYTEQLALIVTHVNHIINATGGKFGIGILRHFNKGEWRLVLSDSGQALALAKTLARVVELSASARDNDGADARAQLLAILTDDAIYDDWLQQVVATSFLMAGTANPNILAMPVENFASLTAQSNNSNTDKNEAVLADIVFRILDRLHAPDEIGNLYPYPTLIRLALSAFGEMTNGEIPHAVRYRALEWCRVFYARFDSFADLELPPEQWSANKIEDRLLIAKCQMVMSALSPATAREVLFNELFSGLDLGFDPRTDRNLAHNAYYRRIGSAQTLAGIDGKKCLAFKRRLDQENNEWGRVVEREIRDNEFFRLDFLKEAKAQITGQTSPIAADAVRRYDPAGILRRNTALLHVLRYLYVNRLRFDPADENTPSCGDYLDSLDIGSALSARFPASVYEREAREFDVWLLQLKRDNPEFADQLKKRVTLLGPEYKTFPIETFFLECNEIETWQFETDPADGPRALIGFIGAIRSWTSGYHGRLLPRYQAFMDQDRIRRDKSGNPRDYRRPADYYPDYSALMSRERFDVSILPILGNGETPSNDPALNLSAEEALVLIRHFRQSGFTAYLPSWMLFLIEHRFIGENGIESFTPMRNAFEALKKTGLPRSDMRDVFAERGYLGDPQFSVADQRVRQIELNAGALAVLSHLPDHEARRQSYDDDGAEPIRKKILRASRRDINPFPSDYDDITAELLKSEIAPGEYFNYRPQARTLLKTHTPQSIRVIMESALNEVTLEFPANAPLSPLFPGIPGKFVTDDKLEKSLLGIATAGQSEDKGIGRFINFSTIMIGWAKRNHIDLTRAFSQAVSAYTAPSSLVILQRVVENTRLEIFAVETEMAQCQTESGLMNAPDDEELRRRLAELRARLAIEEEKRNLEVLAMAEDPSRKNEQSLFQIIAHLYNAVRRQYLKEVLITGGPVTGKLIEDYLEEVLIPEKRRLTDLWHENRDTATIARIMHVKQRIDFLMDVLAEMESVR